MNKKFTHNLFFLISLNVLIKPFWILGIDRNVQNILGAEVYGLYFTLFNFTYLFNIFLDLGITSYNNKSLAQSPNAMNGYLNDLLPLKFYLSVVYAFILFVVAWFLGYGRSEMWLLISLAFNQFLQSILLYIRSNFSALHRFKLDSIFSVLDKLIVILLCCLMFTMPFLRSYFSIQWFVGLQTIAYLFSIGLALYFLLQGIQLHFQFKLKQLYGILKQSYPYALLALLMAAYTRIDSLLLERLQVNGAYQAGVYAQAFRLLDVGNNFAYLFGGLLLPIFARMLFQNQSVNSLVNLAAFLLLYPAILVAIFCLLFGDKIMLLLYPSALSQSSDLLKILMFSFVMYCFTYIYGALLTANGRLKLLNKIAITCLLFSIFLNLILITRFGVMGSAISNLMTQILSAGLQFYFAKQAHFLKPNWLNILKIISGITCISLICWFLKSINLDFIFIAILFMGLNGLLVLKMVDVQKITGIFKS